MCTQKLFLIVIGIKIHIKIRFESYNTYYLYTALKLKLYINNIRIFKTLQI